MTMTPKEVWTRRNKYYIIILETKRIFDFNKLMHVKRNNPRILNSEKIKNRGKTLKIDIRNP